MPNFISALKSKWKTVVMSLLVLIAVAVGFERLSTRDVLRANLGGASEVETAEPPSQLASNDPVVLAKQNELDQSLKQTKTLMTDLKQELLLLKNQRLETGNRHSNGNQNYLTRTQAQAMVRQAVADSEAAFQRRLAAQAQQEPTGVAWQEVGPEKEPLPVVVATPPEPEVSYVTVMAGSNAHARSFNGILTLANGLEKTIVLEIGDVEDANGGRIPLDACRVVVRYRVSQAEATIAKIPMQLKTLSCMMPSGKAVSVPVSGYISSLDDVDGVPATVIWQNPELLQKVLQAAAPAVLVSLAKETRDRTTRFGPLGDITTTGNDVAQDAASQIVDMYLRQAEFYVLPILAVKPNIQLNIYFDETFQLPVDPSELMASGFNPDTYN